MSSEYLKRLPHHPGFLIAVFLIILGAISAGWLGAVIMAVCFGTPVLITNKK